MERQYCKFTLNQQTSSLEKYLLGILGLTTFLINLHARNILNNINGLSSIKLGILGGKKIPPFHHHYVTQSAPKVKPQPHQFNQCGGLLKK